jgi:alpha-tubulin suppressor-like RCC1 family protein
MTVANVPTLWGSGKGGQLGLGYPLELSVFPYPQTPNLSNVKQVGLGGGWGGVLLKDGTVRTQGDNFFGATGQGVASEANNVFVPTKLSFARLGIADNEVEELSFFGGSGMARLTSGQCVGWGANGSPGEQGVIGVGDALPHYSPVAYVQTAAGVPLKEVVKIVMGKDVCWFLLASGLVYRTGAAYRQGLYSYAIQVVNNKTGEPLKEVAEIAGSHLTACFLKTDGSIWTKGTSGYGQLGNNTRPEATTSAEAEPIQKITKWYNTLGEEIKVGSRTIIGIAAADYHFVALMDNGHLLSWGRNTEGQLGNGQEGAEFVPGEKCVLVPTEVPGIEHVVAIACGGTESSGGSEGGQYSMALLESGGVRMWGGNVKGMLGDATRFNKPSPIETLAGYTGITQIVASQEHAAILQASVASIPQSVYEIFPGIGTFTAKWNQAFATLMEAKGPKGETIKDHVESWTLKWRREEFNPGYFPLTGPTKATESLFTMSGASVKGVTNGRQMIVETLPGGETHFKVGTTYYVVKPTKEGETFELAEDEAGTKIVKCTAELTAENTTLLLVEGKKQEPWNTSTATTNMGVLEGTVTNTSKEMTGVTSFAGHLVGAPITGPGIPAPTTVESVNEGAKTLQLSKAATSSPGKSKYNAYVKEVTVTPTFGETWPKATNLLEVLLEANQQNANAVSTATSHVIAAEEWQVEWTDQLNPAGEKEPGWSLEARRKTEVAGIVAGLPVKLQEPLTQFNGFSKEGPGPTSFRLRPWEEPFKLTGTAVLKAKLLPLEKAGLKGFEVGKRVQFSKLPSGSKFVKGKLYYLVRADETGIEIATLEGGGALEVETKELTASNCTLELQMVAGEGRYKPTGPTKTTESRIQLTGAQGSGFHNARRVKFLKLPAGITTLNTTTSYFVVGVSPTAVEAGGFQVSALEGAGAITPDKELTAANTEFALGELEVTECLGAFDPIFDIRTQFVVPEKAGGGFAGELPRLSGINLPGTTGTIAAPYVTVPSPHERPQVGDELKASPGVWTDASKLTINPAGYKYQWWSKEQNSESGWTKIPGAMSSSYTVEEAYLGQGIQVEVWAENSVGAAYFGQRSALTLPVVVAAPETSPTVTKVEPNAGPLAGGTSVAITGTNLTGATAVKFGAANAASFTVNSATSITAVSPAGTGSVDVTVSTPVGTSATGAADQFSYGEREPEPEPGPAVLTEWRGNEFQYFAYDMLTGRFMGEVPLRGVQFGQQLDTSGQLTGTLDLQDPRVQAAFPLQSTIPNRTFIVVDYNGAVVWGGVVMPRKWKVSTSGGTTTRALEVQCVELWTYFQSRVQATDYSSPPYSGISGSLKPMGLWTQTPWDASLIACQIIEDAIGYTDGLTQPYGNPLGGMGILLNGEIPSASRPAAPAGDYVAVSYPFQSMQTVDTIVTQLSQLGLGVGFDHGIDIAYTSGPASPPIATLNISYPRRGRTTAQSNLMIDLSTAREYEFPEDGSQTANQIYEIGGSSAINVSQNIFPLQQGYPLWERVISRANIQSQNIMSVLERTGYSDLAIYSYAPVTPSVTLGAQDTNLPLGSFIVGDDVNLVAPALGANGEAFDPRFPAGLNQEWRIISYQVTVADDGDITNKLTLAQPPNTEALTPAV